MTYKTIVILKTGVFLIDTNKKNMIISRRLIAVGIVLVAVCVLIRVIGGSRSYELHLPDFNNLKGVTLTHRGGEAVELPGAMAEDVLFVLTGEGRKTNVESIQDAPVNVDDYIQVDFAHKGGGTSTLFVYQRPDAREGEFFIEQPYNGIYVISRHEYECVEQYAS